MGDSDGEVWWVVVVVAVAVAVIAVVVVVVVVPVREAPAWPRVLANKETPGAAVEPAPSPL